MLSPQVTFDCFPGGRRRAVTLSYDDGHINDRRLVALLNQHGLRGTFNLNSGALGTKNKVKRNEVRALYAGHEVAAHSVTHPCLSHLTGERLVQEIVEDRRALEQLVGYPVRGFAYPGGDFSDAIAEKLVTLGCSYARSTVLQAAFTVSEDFMRWPINAGLGDALAAAEAFLKLPPLYGLQVLHHMGHAADFTNPAAWDSIVEFCARLGGKAEVWYATNIEIVDYLRAARCVRASVDGTLLYNPSGIEVWFSDWSAQPSRFGKIGPGETVRVSEALQS